jgi:curved DNA-binding protein CbpA
VNVDRYQGFVFGPGDLSEDVEIDVERRKEILFAEAQLVRWTHWEVLGIPWNAPASAAKEAYRERVKVFHPDRYAGRRLGSYRGRLERVFRRLTEARDVLQVEETRAAYARSSAPADELARMEARRLDDERRAAERRARLTRANPLLARAARIAELVQRGKAALAAGNLSAAANDLLLAQGLDPANHEIAALAADAKRRASVARATDLFHRGLEADARGNAAGALTAYREALEVDPGNVRAAAFGAKAAALLGDVATARTLADAALKAGPRTGIAHEALGVVLEAESNPKEARRALEKALELEPKLESAKVRLKKLRWRFLG